MAVPPDILAALAGGGDPAAGPMMGDPAAAGPLGGAEALPPDILAALGGGMEDPAGLEAGGEDPQALYDAAMDATDDTEVLTEWAIQAVQKCIGLDPDAEDKLLLQKIMTDLQQYSATHQKRTDSLLSGKADPASLRQATSGY